MQEVFGVERKNWFGPKRLGFARAPVRWQGWLATAAWILAVYSGLMMPSQLVSDRATAVLAAIVFTFVFTASYYFVTEAHGDSANP